MLFKRINKIEEWARRIISIELSKDVHINDDGSSNGMYDLRVGPPAAPELAIECVGSVDPVSMATWNEGPAKGPIPCEIPGRWIIVIEKNARIKRIRQNLNSLLLVSKSRDVNSIRVDSKLKYEELNLYHNLKSYGISHIICVKDSGEGRVDLMYPANAGFTDSTGKTVPDWISSFIAESKYEDVLRKISDSKSPINHVFVHVTLYGAPTPIILYLMGDLDILPDEPPLLPDPVDCVWIASTFGSSGIWWNGEVWKTFRSKGEGIEY